MSDTSGTSAKRVRDKWKECNKSATQMIETRLPHEYYLNYKSATWEKNFDFDNDMSENIILQL